MKSEPEYKIKSVPESNNLYHYSFKILMTLQCITNVLNVTSQFGKVQEIEGEFRLKESLSTTSLGGVHIMQL